MYLNRNQITITAKGQADSGFSHASFKLSLSTVAETGPAAKEKARPLIDAILAVVTEQAEAAQIDAARLKTTFSIEPHRVYEENRTPTHRGYKADYSISFSAKNLALATDLHDRLTNLNGITAESPTFHVGDEAEVTQRAFADAWQKAKATFEAQCATVGLSPLDWEIVAWEEESAGGGGGKMLSASGGPTTRIEPGKAIYQVTIGFLFARKGT